MKPTTMSSRMALRDTLDWIAAALVARAMQTGQTVDEVEVEVDENVLASLAMTRDQADAAIRKRARESIQ